MPMAGVWYVVTVEAADCRSTNAHIRRQAYYNEQHKLLQIRGTDAAASSPLAEQVGRRNIQTHNLLAHIRYATQGAVDHKNVHPFSRTLWGEEWSFGHNEDVPVIPSTRRGPFAPQGGTDSEAMFCTILNGLSERFGSEKPASSAISRVVHMDRKGTILNFLLTCGPSQQWAYSWPGQRPGSKTWNGLHYSTSSNMCMFATKPVTDSSNWVEMEPHELIQVCHGVMQRVR